MDALQEFETYRSLMFAIAYRMLGSAMDAEDVVQETYLRYRGVPAETIASVRAFLTTVVTRLCLNRLHSARTRRETYIGPWLPEPLLTESDPAPTPPDRLLLHESLAMAFLVLLEELTPVERAVFLLREVFAYEYAEIAAIVDKSEPACRQLFHRAKQQIAARRPRFTPDHEGHRQLLAQFLRAVSLGDMGGLLQLLAADVTLWADGGGKARGAATRPLQGRDAVARFMLASTRLPDAPYYAEIRTVNGEPALILRTADRPFLVLFLTVAQAEVTEIRIAANPEKLQRV